MAGFGGCACAGLAFLAAAVLGFTFAFALALFETVRVAGAFDAAASALRVVAFLGAAFVVTLFAAVVLRAAVLLVPVRRLEPVVSVGLIASVTVSAAFGSAGAALFRPG